LTGRPFQPADPGTVLAFCFMCRSVPAPRRRSAQGDTKMGKYLVGWLLGVPVIVLVILYFFFH
jgi:hypothetical protein